MKNAVRSRKLWSWWIALAIFMTALAPLLHHGNAGATVDGLAGSALCTTDGIKWFNPDTGQIEEAPPGPGHQFAGRSCECCTGTTPGIVASQASPGLRPPAAAASFRASSTPAPPSRVDWHQFNPRAPPRAA